MGWLPAKYFPFDTRQNSPSHILCPSLALLMNENSSLILPYVCLVLSSILSVSPNNLSPSPARLTHSVTLESPQHSRNHFMCFSSCRLGPAFIPLLICLLHFSSALIAKLGSRAHARGTLTYVLAPPSKTDLEQRSLNQFLVSGPLFSHFSN